MLLLSWSLSIRDCQYIKILTNHCDEIKVRIMVQTKPHHARSLARTHTRNYAALLQVAVTPAGGELELTVTYDVSTAMVTVKVSRAARIPYRPGQDKVLPCCFVQMYMHPKSKYVHMLSEMLRAPTDIYA